MSRKLSNFLFLSILTSLAMILAMASVRNSKVIYEFEDTFRIGEALPPVEVIVCLAGGRGRIRLASELWYEYYMTSQKSGVPAPLLYFSGIGRDATWEALSTQLSPDALRVLEKEREKFVLIENQSANTYENAELLAQNAKKKSWERFLLITSSYHMKRAYYLLDRMLRISFQDKYKILALSHVQSPYTLSEWRSDRTAFWVTIGEYWKWKLYTIFWQP